MPPLLLRQDEVAELLQVSTRTVRAMAAAGQIPRVVLSPRATRYRLADVEALVEALIAPLNDERPASTPGAAKDRLDGADGGTG